MKIKAAEFHLKSTVAISLNSPAIPQHHSVAMRTVAPIVNVTYWCQRANVDLFLKVLYLCILTCLVVP